jgi:hypothetical protein
MNHIAGVCHARGLPALAFIGRKTPRCVGTALRKVTRYVSTVPSGSLVAPSTGGGSCSAAANRLDLVGRERNVNAYRLLTPSGLLEPGVGLTQPKTMQVAPRLIHACESGFLKKRYPLRG